MLRVYNYMAGALLLTGITAYLSANYSPLMNAMFHLQGGHPVATWFGWFVLLTPGIFVLAINIGVVSTSLFFLQCTFWAYSACMGISLSSVFLIYAGVDMVRAFFTTAIMFGSISIFGYTTKRDLTSIGHFVSFAFAGIILACLVNFYMHASASHYVMSFLTISGFMAVAAYDTQKLKAFYYQVPDGDTSLLGVDMQFDIMHMHNGPGMSELPLDVPIINASTYEAPASKSAIMGAVILYVDFIALFFQFLYSFYDRKSENTPSNSL